MVMSSNVIAHRILDMNLNFKDAKIKKMNVCKILFVFVSYYTGFGMGIFKFKSIFVMHRRS